MAVSDIMVKVGADVTQFSRAMANASKDMEKLGKNMSGITGAITNVGSTLTKAITVPAAAAASALIGVTAVKGFGRLIGIDTARAKLTALGHSADSVEVIMTNALDSVRGTAYGLDEAATAAASAVAAGIEPGKELTKYLTLTGDAAAVAGSDFNEMARIFNLVQTAQRAYTGELNMLADRGIPIYQWIAEEADTTAQGVREMASDGEVSAELFRKAIEKNIGGAAQTIGEQSFAAALRNIGSDIARIGANFLDAGGEAGGFFSTVKPMLTEFRGYLASLEPMASELGRKFGEAFNRMIERLRAMKSWYDGLHPVMQGFVKTLAAIGAVIAVTAGPALILLGKSLSFAFTTLPGLIKGLKEIAPFLKGAVTLFRTAGKAVLRFAGPVGLAITAAMLLASVIKHYWEPISGLATNLWSGITSAFKKGIGAIDRLTNGWASNGIAVYKAWAKTLTDIIKRFWSFVKESFNNGLDFLQAFFQLDLSGMIDAIKNQFKSIGAVFADSWSIIKDGMTKPLKDLSESVRKTFSDLFRWINDKTNGYLDAFIAVWKDGFQALKDLVGPSLDFVKTTLSNTMDYLKGLVTLDFGKMKEAVRNQLDATGKFISEAWSTIKDNMGDSLKNMIEIARNNFVEMKDRVIERLSEMGDSISTWFSDSVGTIREKLGEWRETIAEWFEGMPELIVQKLEGWRDAMTEWTKKQHEENKRQFDEWRTSIAEWFQSIPEQIGQWLSGWGERISDWFVETKDKIKSRLGEWRDAISEWFKTRPAEIGEHLSNWWTKMGEWFSEIPSRIKEKLEEWWQAIKEWFKSVPNKPEIKDAGKKMVDKVAEGNNEKRQDFITKLGRLIIDVAKAAVAMAFVALFAAGREIIRDIIEGVNNMRETLKRKALELIQKFAQTIQSVDLVQVGKNIINGLIRGIGSMAESVWNKAKEIGSGIISTISSAVQTRSPSRLTTQIGEWVGQGLANGLTDTVRQVDRASEMLAKAAVPDVDLSYATPNGIHSSLTSAVRGTVDVNDSRDEALVRAIGSLERRLGDLEVVMDGERVGRIVTPHVNEGNAVDANVRRYFD